MSFILLYDYRDPRLIEQTVDVDRPAAAERDRPEQAHPVIAAGGIGEVFEKGKEREQRSRWLRRALMRGAR